MNRQEKLMEEVELFYNDIIKIVENRIEKNKKIIENSSEKEEKLKNDIKKIENKIEEIKNDPKNHINENIEYHLLPKVYMEVDKLKKDIDYKNQELTFLHEYNEDEKKELYKDYEKYLAQLIKYYYEKDNIIRCIRNQQILSEMNRNNIEIQEIINIRNQNDYIFGQYLPNSGGN